jgi:hypothetical protein
MGEFGREILGPDDLSTSRTLIVVAHILFLIQSW